MSTGSTKVPTNVPQPPVLLPPVFVSEVIAFLCLSSFVGYQESCFTAGYSSLNVLPLTHCRFLLIKNKFRGLAFGVAVKLPLEMPTSHKGVPGFQSQLHSYFRLPATVYPGRQQVMVQILGALHPRGRLWVSSYWLWARPCPVLVAAAICGVNH